MIGFGTIQQWRFKKDVSQSITLDEIMGNGYSEQDRLEEIIRLGADVYVRKPYNLIDLGVTVKDTLLGK